MEYGFYTANGVGHCHGLATSRVINRIRFTVRRTKFSPYSTGRFGVGCAHVKRPFLGVRTMGRTVKHVSRVCPGARRCISAVKVGKDSFSFIGNGIALRVDLRDFSRRGQG